MKLIFLLLLIILIYSMHAFWRYNKAMDEFREVTREAILNADVNVLKKFNYLSKIDAMFYLGIDINKLIEEKERNIRN